MSNFEWGPGIPIIDKDDETQSEKMKYFQHMKTSTITTSLKMWKMKEESKKRHMNMSIYKIGKIIQVTTSSKSRPK